jgi:hypothetical protein
MRRYVRAKAQALVEFALAATLIFMLLSAAVDLGLMYLALQGIRTAAQEGATFGSHARVINNDVVIDIDEVRNRVRESAGDSPVGFANLLDLDNDDVLDVTGGRIGEGGESYDEVNNGEDFDPGASNRVVDQFIIVQTIFDQDTDGQLPDGVVTDADQLCTPQILASPFNRFCYVRVTVRYRYELLFALAPAFGDHINLRAEFAMPVRSTFRQGS